MAIKIASLMNRVRSQLLLGLAVTYSSSLFGQVDLPSQPLLTTTTVRPNIMLLFDDSNSMDQLVTPDYIEQSSLDAVDCPASRAIFSIQDLPSTANRFGFQVTIDRITVEVMKGPDSVARIRVTEFIADTNIGLTRVLEWGTDPDEDNQGCFKESSSGDINRYRVSYIDGENTSITLPGQFWNYYFANSDFNGPDSWPGDNVDRKPNVDSRISITRNAGQALVSSLRDVRLGFATFQSDQDEDIPGGTGALIHNQIDDITANPSHADAIITAIGNTTPAFNTTPIAEAISDIGRYFVTGTNSSDVDISGNVLMLHPDNAELRRTAAASAIFPTEPTYDFIAGTEVRQTAPSTPVIQESCQANYIVALTDGEPNEISNISNLVYGSTNDSNSDSIIDYSDSDQLPYDFFGVNNEALRHFEDDRGNGNTNDDFFSGGIDDIVLAVRDIDLRTDLDRHNSISTYIIGGFDASLEDTAVLNRAANNGVEGPGSVYFAADRDQLTERLNEIFVEINTSTGSFSSAAFNSGAIQAGTGIFQASFSFSGSLWSGDLQAFPLATPPENATANTPVFSSTPIWSADALLSQRVIGNNGADRNIITLSGSGDGVPFTVANYRSDLFTAELSADLNSTNLTADDIDGVGETITEPAELILEYLRGRETPLLRTRIPSEAATAADGTTTIIPAMRGILGDIVNSSPIEVSAPELDYPDYDAGAAVRFGAENNNYSTYVASNANRRSAVYVGANDGMLHAFDGTIAAPADNSSAGQELFAYMPSLLADGSDDTLGFSYLTSIHYQHDFYVDGELTASDVFIDPVGSTSAADRSWRTVLVGALGNGGRGLFALDVTDPTPTANQSEFAESLVLWEFGGTEATGDADMGHVFGEPKVAMMNDGRFAVVTGNGVNSDNGDAVLFINFIEGGVDGSSWDEDQEGIGLDYIKISTGDTTGNGLFEPVLADLNGDQVVDRIYAGDLLGNLWVFDVSSDTPSNWGVAYLDGTTPEPLFNTADGGNGPFPITTAPLVIRNEARSSVGNGANTLVLFGAGQLLEHDDFADRSRQRFYAVWDRGQSNITSSSLVTRNFVTSVVGEGENARTMRTIDGNTPINWYDSGTDSGDYGWLLNLGIDGERVIVEPTILLNTILFISSVPQASSCDAGGRGFLNALGVDGLPTTLPVYDYDGDGDIDIDDSGEVSVEVTDGIIPGTSLIGGGSASSNQPCPRGNGIYQAYTNSNGDVAYRWLCPDASSGLGRVAWQELFTD